MITALRFFITPPHYHVSAPLNISRELWKFRIGGARTIDENLFRFYLFRLFVW
jgi:hypothetical protein